MTKTTMYDVEYHISTVFIYHCEAEDEEDARKQFETTNITKSMDIGECELNYADVKVMRVSECDETVPTDTHISDKETN